MVSCTWVAPPTWLMINSMPQSDLIMDLPNNHSGEESSIWWTTFRGNGWTLNMVHQCPSRNLDLQVRWCQRTFESINNYQKVNQFQNQVAQSFRVLVRIAISWSWHACGRRWSRVELRDLDEESIDVIHVDDLEAREKAAKKQSSLWCWRIKKIISKNDCLVKTNASDRMIR